MADYYPLIARAITGLGADSSAESRSNMYARATQALLAQLRSIEPPLSEAEIAREREALEAAVTRVEQEVRIGRAVVAGHPAHEPVMPRPIDDIGPADHAFEPEAEPVPTEHDIGDQGADEPGPGSPNDGLDASELQSPRHPQAPRPETRERLWIRGTIVGGCIALVVALTGYAAWRLRDKAADFQRPVAEQAQQQKFDDRLGDAGTPSPAPAVNQAQSGATPTPPVASGPAATGPASSPVPASPAIPAGQGQPQGTPAPPPVGQMPMPPLSVMQRAILVEEPEQGQQARVTQGSVSWRLETVPGNEGGYVDNAIRASLNIADAGIGADIMIRKNRDAALPASHTIEARFTTGEKSVNGKIRDMTVPEMRVEENQRGTMLTGLPVPVMENMILVGLSNSPADVERNTDLLKNRNWIVVLVRFTNNKRALLIFEKGSSGDRVFEDAFKAWK